MNIVILGAGALGTVLGAHLARAGEDVALIARGNRAAHLRAHGATITGLADFTQPVAVVTDPREVRSADVLIVTVKTYDMEAALASVKHIEVGSVLSIQNGVAKNEQLADVFGWDRVLGAMAFVSAEVLTTGAARFTVNQGFYLGELPEGTSTRVQALADALNQAGIVTVVTPSIQSIEWAKYVSFVCLMAPAVLTRLETYKIWQAGATAAISAAIVHETARLANARNIALEDIALFPSKTLSDMPLAEATARIQQIGAQFAEQAPAHKLSTLQDLEQGKRLELEETLGYAVRQAAKLGVATPTMDTCYQLISVMSQHM